MNYRIDLNLNDEIAPMFVLSAYSRIREKYNALGIGHERTGTSTMFTSSINPKDLEKLMKELKAERIEILSVQPTFSDQRQLN